MAMVLQVGEPQDLPPVPNGFPQCRSYQGQVPPSTNPEDYEYYDY